MDITTKNETGVGSERLRTFDLVWAFPSEKTKLLKARALALGFYFSGSDAGLYRSVLTFLSDVGGFSDLPEFERSGEDTKFSRVWKIVHANPTLDANEVQEMAGGKCTTNRVAISWLGSVLEHLGQHVPSVETYRLGLKSVMSRPAGRGRQADPAKTIERVKAVVSNMTASELLALLSPGQLEDMKTSLKPSPKGRERRK